jgi:Na+-driven multidrug efflux pump
LQATGQIHATTRAGARAFFRFSLGAIAFASALLFALGWLPACRRWLLSEVFPLPPELAEYIRPGLRALCIAPVFLGLRTCFKGMILASGRTGVIFVASTVYVLLAAAAGCAALRWLPHVNAALIGVWLVILVEASEAAILGMTASRRLLWRNESGPTAPPLSP